MKSFTKIFTSFLIVLVMGVIIFAPTIDVHGQATAPDPKGAQVRAQSADKDSEVYCVRGSWLSFADLSPGGCLLLFFGHSLSYALNIFSYLITLTAALFDIALGIQNEAFQDQPIVNAGWMISRDVVNIVYIFILLIIAIATILKIESYGMKSLLAKLIISALLVNFSLALAGIIVDASNALGNQFYSAMGAPNADIDGDGNPDGRDIATTFVSGFAPQNIIAPNDASVGEAFGTYRRLINVIIAYLMGIGLVLIASFVIGAGAILLVIRIVYIWILFILAPFAFLFYVLPTTSGMAQKWFRTLFEQSFFYPAYMFFLYLVFKIIAEGGITALVDKASVSADLTSALEGEGVSILTASAGLVLGFIFLGVLLIASLLAAKSMSAAGAGGALKIGGKFAQYARGASGRGALRLARKPAGAVLQRMPKGRVAKALTAPISRSLRTIASKGEDLANKRAKDEAKKAKGRDPRTTARMMATMNASAQKEVFEQMKDNKQRGEVASELKNFMGPEGVGRISQSLKKQGVSDNDVRAFAARGGGVHAAMRLDGEYANMQKAPTGDPAYSKRMDDMMNAMSKEDRHEIYRNEGETNEHVQDYFLRNEKNFENFTQSRKDIDHTSAMLGAIKKRTKATDSADLAKKIEVEYKNPDLAQQFSANPGIRLAHAGSLRDTAVKMGDLNAKKGNIESDQAKLRVRYARTTDLAEKDRVKRDIDRNEDRIHNIDRQINAQEERQKRTQEKIADLDNPRQYTGNIILETPSNVSTTPAKGKSDVEKEVDRLKREMGDKADKES